MSHEMANAAALLFLAGVAFYLGTLWTNTDAGGGNGCRRRGCGRMPAGIGCNHRPRTDGPASGTSCEGEDDERI